ncbi:CatB-related O-acetyltransferase [Cellulophaga lytica]|uniref:CatB-related O-acetyltransferase n=1 Tax=Cellulophaga lytica TaxID=979 RepID=UPI000B5CD408|nr:CatB-related O-acetyltransferase [Cellulophaga lytica]SNQ44085.1 Hexapeptide repeat-containing protein acetyltransferase [Cellulophaga lytica]
MKNKIKKLILNSGFLTKCVMYFRRLRLKKTLGIKYGKNAFIGFSTICEGKNSFGKQSVITSSKIGYGSYIGDSSNFSKTKIGRYCSIGPNVSCVYGKHPSHTHVSTHPSFFSVNHSIGFSYVEKQSFNEFSEPRDKEGKYSIVIGNDVWIGANVTILEGVIIGDGAIVAANTLVVKDVKSYSIVGGVPAKKIKDRFSEEDIVFLKKIEWWNKPMGWIKKYANYFNDISKFKKAIKDVSK